MVGISCCAGMPALPDCVLFFILYTVPVATAAMSTEEQKSRRPPGMGLSILIYISVSISSAWYAVAWHGLSPGALVDIHPFSSYILNHRQYLVFYILLYVLYLTFLALLRRHALQAAAHGRLAAHPHSPQGTPL